MSLLDANLLTILTFVPAIGAVLALLLRGRGPGVVRTVALASSFVTLALALRAVVCFDTSRHDLQLVARFEWIPTIHADYFVGVDGLGILLIVLAALVVPLAIIASWSVVENVGAYFFFLLMLQTGALGVFTAQSFFHWFLFWELVLVPAFFLVKMWGGPGADRAALKFFLYTLVGSVAMLLAFQAMYLAVGTLDFVELKRLGESGELATRLAGLAQTAGLGWSASTCGMIAFGSIVFACAVKTPMWPFHTWQADVYAEAPTATTMLLTALMSKMGIYALLRIALPLFPQQAVAASTVLLVLAVITVVAGALAAYAQTDLKRMMAYSSMNHVGYCLVAVFAAAAPVAGAVATAAGATLDDRAASLDGAVLQMFNHGVTAAALFFLLGALERRTGRRGIDDFGGLRARAPVFCLLFGISLFSSLGLPALNGFVGELLILRGAIATAPVFAAVSTLGLVITAVFLLRIMQRVWSGPLDPRCAQLPDLTLVERTAAGAFVILMFVGGLYPAPFVRAGNETMRTLATTLAAATGDAR